MSDQSTRLSAALSGRYRIERELGAGGMATVYLAFDEKHDRKVAIKVLKPELAAVLGAERFVVEIKTTAAMSHPHILPLFDSGTADGFLFYVMPYIQGETIREKLNRETQFGVDEAVRIAREVADALDYAHRHGVIHRDIKPENILLHDGRAMVMDFGIALAVSAAAGGRMTETGLSLGTPHYMSPEQATAEKEITGRSDQYSLASVLYEMLSGDPPFVASAAQAVIMKIITEPAQSVTTRRKNVPANVDAALGKALEKLPADRFESAKAFADALANPAFSGGTGAQQSALAGSARPRMRDPVFLAMAAVAVIALLVAGRSTLQSRANVAPVRATRVVLAMPASAEFWSWRASSTPGLRQFALSPDGSTLVYRGVARSTGTVTSQLWQRKLDDLTATPIPGTEDAEFPLFSKRGDFLAFFAGRGGRIGVLPVSGGPIVWFNRALSAMAWGDDDALYFRRSNHVARWTPGAPDAVDLPPIVNVGTVSDVLPGSKTILLSAAGVMVGVNLTTGDTTNLGEGSNPRYLSSGYLVYSLPESRAMMLQPFDPATLTVLGPAIASPDAADRGSFDVSGDGSMVYQEMTDSGGVRLTWVNKAGLRSPLDWIVAASYDGYALSPRGDKLAIATGSSGAQRDLWIYDLQSRARLPITRDGASTRPRWHPTEPRVLFVHSMDGQSSVRSIPADGSGAAEQVVKITPGAADAQWLPDGKELVIRMPGASPRNIFRFVPGKDSTPVPFLNRQFQERNPAPSPDGHWLVYTSDQSGQDEVYAQPYPGGGAVIPISLAGGYSPVWSRDGRELMYLGSDGFMWSARVALGQGTFRVESRTRLFSVDGFIADQHRPRFDMAPDGRFLMQVPVQASQGERLVLVRNWAQSLTRSTGK